MSYPDGEDGGRELRFRALEVTVRSLARQVQALDERVDTVAAPPWKKLWWLLQGFRWYRVGRWYGKTADLK